MNPIDIYRRLYRLLPRALRSAVVRRSPPGVGVFPVELYDGNVLLLDDMARSVMLRRMFWEGVEGHEPATVRLFHLLAREAAVVLNLGAFVGTFSLVAARANPELRVHSVEPLPDNVELHRRLVALNGLDERITIHATALGRDEGEVAFHRPIDRRGRLADIGALKNRFAAGERFAGRPFETLRVPCRPLDRLWEQIGRPRIDLVKLDVEEAEDEVVASGEALFAACRPDLVVEVIFGSADLDRLGERLAALGYRFHEIGVNGLRPLAGLTEPPGTTHDDTRTRKRRGGLTDRFCTCRSDDAVATLSRDLRGLPTPA